MLKLFKYSENDLRAKKVDGGYECPCGGCVGALEKIKEEFYWCAACKTVVEINSADQIIQAASMNSKMIPPGWDKKPEECSNCRYFDAAGVCRRYPPREKWFPPVPATEWCGEYKAKGE
jgi:hypothetical protein